MFNSQWIDDMAEFSTVNRSSWPRRRPRSVRLDSLSPTGTLREAQGQPGRSDQGHLLRDQRHLHLEQDRGAGLVPAGDVVLIDRDCHKSHHYGLVPSDARPVYLDAYPLPEYGFYGGVPLRTLKEPAGVQAGRSAR